MNPEEGELRPQLLDRFGLCVNITSVPEPEQRVRIVKNRAQFEDDPDGLVQGCRPAEEALAGRIARAQQLLPSVVISDDLLTRIARIGIALAVDGHRSDLVMMKSACTAAAFEGRTEVRSEDIDASVDLALTHRMRRRPFEDREIDPNLIDDLLS
jgi:magnesium chelatase subunit I